MKRARLPGLALLTIGLTLAAPVEAAPSCQPGENNRSASTGLVFSGGGAKGAYEAGVALGLKERGVSVTAVAGSSAGALNAALVASGQEELLVKLWREISNDQVYRLPWSMGLAGLLPGWVTLWYLDHTGALFDLSPLRALLAERVDLARLREAEIRLFVVALDLVSGEKRIFTNRDITHDVLLASASVPGVFAPVAVDGQLLVDGGLMDRAPLLDLLELVGPVDRALTVVGYGDPTPLAPPLTLRRILERTLELALPYQIVKDAELARHRRPDVAIHLLFPSEPLWLRPLEFEGERIARAVELGRKDAHACLDRLGG